MKEKGCSAAAERAKAVSYTHLDVYKRQTQNAEAQITAPQGESYRKSVPACLAGKEGTEALKENMARLEVCCQKGLSERFDSSIGAGTVLMPFSGEYQLTPEEAMVAKVPLLHGETDDATAMSYGYIPGVARYSPFEGAAYAVVESLSKLAAVGADPLKARLTFQEYFERLHDVPSRWGKPAAALLGALEAQLGMGLPSIGGKDSMSGSFEPVSYTHLSQPAAAPYPVADDGIDDQGEHKGEDDEGEILDPFRHSAGDNGGRGPAEHQLEEEFPPERHVGSQGPVIERQILFTQDEQVLCADKGVVASKHETPSKQHEAQGGNREHDEVFGKDVHGVFRPGHAGFQRREAQVHKEHQDCRKKDPQGINDHRETNSFLEIYLCEAALPRVTGAGLHEERGPEGLLLQGPFAQPGGESPGLLAAAGIRKRPERPKTFQGAIAAEQRNFPLTHDIILRKEARVKCVCKIWC